ncbi:MAG TPA: DUF4388 domain-containing protein [Ktedonobacteraceae bacterium]|nr:DUF4388 domain-containing protein [Ktedonobacteraceae bacterium]
MSQRRGTTTDRLSNVIEVIQLGRRTGFLTVERGEGPGREEGELTFVHGQITYARGGQLVGQRALEWLHSWGACRFTFVSSVPGRSTRPLHETPRTLSTPSFRDTGAYPRQTFDTPHPPTPPYIIQDREWNEPPPNGFGVRTSSLSFSNPRRTRQDDEALRLLDQAGLSRLHRHLFLLIDGRRNTIELTRLIARPQEEVQRLLYDLERIGIIQQ